MWVNMSIFFRKGGDFGIDTQVTPESNIGYVILIYEVICGHHRSTTVNWGHWGKNCKMTLRDAIFCIYTHMIPRNNVGYVNLTSKSIEVIGGENSEVIECQKLLTKVIT